MKAHELPAGAIVASESRVWIKRNSADRYPPPHPGYEEWWTEGTTYAVPISNSEVAEMLEMRAVDLLRPVPNLIERAEWSCVRCGYQNRGPVCTHCGRPLVVTETKAGEQR